MYTAHAEVDATGLHFGYLEHSAGLAVSGVDVMCIYACLP